MRIAILTRPDSRSPRILTDSLRIQFQNENVEVEIFDNVNLLNRLIPFKNSKLSLHFWLRRKIENYPRDKKLLKKLKRFDAIVISECIPNAFLRRLYYVEEFKSIIQKPVGLYEVYFFGKCSNTNRNLKKK